MPRINTPFIALFTGFVRNNKSYGYLKTPESSDVFIHYSIFKNAGIPREQQIKGLKVEVISVEQTDKGLRAKKVRLIEEIASQQEDIEEVLLPLFIPAGMSFVGEVQKIAYKCAEDGTLLAEKKEYKNTIKSLPMMIRQNGLIATIAYLACHEKEPYQRIYTHLLGRICALDPQIVKENRVDFEKLTSVTVRKLTIETTSFLGWLKYYSDGLISD